MIGLMMSDYLLDQHIKKVCVPHLKEKRFKDCATCPFEDIIVDQYSWLKKLFVSKRKLISRHDEDQGKLNLK